MNVGSLAARTLLVGAIGLVSCGGAPKPYTASATVPCLRERVAVLSQPSRAAARELREGPHRVRVGFVVPSGSTIGTKASGGDYQLGLYPSEEILYFHFARSDREAAALLRSYRSNLNYQIAKRAAERLAYRRRNVVVEWDQHQPSRTEQQVVEQCLMSKRSNHVPRKWRPVPQPTRFVAVSAPRRPPLLQLIPGDAEVVHAWPIASGGGMTPQVAIAWKRTRLAGGSSLDGIVIWERVRRTDSWRLIHSSRFPSYRVGFVYARAGDVNGDRHPDLLLFEDMGGSAGCGVYRLLASVHGRVKHLLVRRGCFDDTRIKIRRGALVMYDGLVRDPRTLDQIHCCWTTWLRTTMRWRGRQLVSTTTKRIRPLPRPVLLSRF
jgi:hypothetical protein